MGWSWFLAVDMQFYVLSPILLIAYYKSKIVGWIMMIAIILSDIATSMTLVWINDLPVFFLGRPASFAEFYQRPYCRSAPYIIGMAAAYILTHIKEHEMKTGRRFTIKPSWLLPLGYVLFGSLFFYIIFGTYGSESWVTWENSFYLGLTRTAWGICLAFFCLTFFLGYGGILRRILSASVFDPLAKLSFGAYLVHPIIMWFFFFAQQDYVFYSDQTYYYLFVSFLILSFLISTLCYLLVEKPIMNLEPMVLRSLGFLVARTKKSLTKQKKQQQQQIDPADSSASVSQVVIIEVK